MSWINPEMLKAIPILDTESRDSFELDIRIAKDTRDTELPADECYTAARSTCAATCSNNLSSCTSSRSCCY